MHITAFSASKRFQAALTDGRISPPHLYGEVNKDQSPVDVFQGADVLLLAAPGTTCLDHVWGFSFDDAGTVTQRWRGRRACLLIGCE